jgi:hypothetical protein
VQEQRERAAGGTGFGGEGILRLGLREARVQGQGVQPQQPPARHVLDEAVGAEAGAPAGMARGIGGLPDAGGRVIAGIVVPGQDQQRQVAEGRRVLGAREVEVSVLVGAVQRDVAGVDDEVRGAGDDGRGQAAEVAGEAWLLRAEVRVGNLGDAEGHGVGPWRPIYACRRSISPRRIFLPRRMRSSMNSASP